MTDRTHQSPPAHQSPHRPRRAAIALRDPLAWRDFAQLARTAEQTGYETLFLPEIAGREAFAALAALAGETSTLGLATGIVPVTSRRPVTTAMATATVHERSGGRMLLGLGTGPAGPGALETLRAYVQVVRSLLGGVPTRVGPGKPVTLTLPAAEPPPPIWISALGPKAMRLAGEIADGVLLNWCPPERVAFARDRVREGAEAAGRDPDEVRIGVYVRACAGGDDSAALDALRRAAGEYAGFPAYRRQFEAVGLGEEAALAAKAHAEGAWTAVPDRLIRQVCVLGDPGVAATRLQAYRDAGADLPVIYPVPALEPVSSILGTLLGLAPDPVLEP